MQIHIFNDEKFVDSTIQNFDAVSPNENLYLILVEDVGKPLKFVKTLDKVSFFKNDDYSNITIFLSSIKKISSIIIHFLSQDKIKLINYLKIKIAMPPIAWFFWGADAYNLEKFESILYQNKTRKFFIEDRLTGIKKLQYYGFSILQKSGIFLKDFLRDKEKIKFISNVDYVVTGIYEDYLLLKSNYKCKGKYLNCNYLSIEQMMNNSIDNYTKGKNILVGNSATITNNHIEIIDILSKQDLRDRKIYFPLNYGVESYKNDVISYGVKKMGVRFIPLHNFLPLKKYNEILATCSIVIMNHNRQQAFTNILATLWMGAKLIMSEESTIYAFLKRLGIHVYSAQKELNKYDSDFLNEMDESLIKENRRILYNYFSNKVNLENIAQLINTIKKNK